jgi:hypothetical protein
LPIVSQSVLCPLHDSQADVTVRTDPDAHPSRQYIDVVACSFLSDAAVALPERRGYLPAGCAAVLMWRPALARPPPVPSINYCRTVPVADLIS